MADTTSSDGEDSSSRVQQEWEVVSLTMSGMSLASSASDPASTDPLVHPGTTNSSSSCCAISGGVADSLLRSQHFVPPQQVGDGLEEASKAAAESDEFAQLEKSPYTALFGKDWIEPTAVPGSSDPQDNAGSMSEFELELAEAGAEEDVVSSLGQEEEEQQQQEAGVLEAEEEKKLVDVTEKKGAFHKHGYQGWWKRRATVWLVHARQANTIWSLALAAAFIGLVFVGQRWYLVRCQNHQLRLQLCSKEDRISELVRQVKSLAERPRVQLMRSSSYGALLN